MDISNLSKDIQIKYNEPEPEISGPFAFSRPHFKVGETDFFLDIKGVAKYRVRDGNTIWVNPYENADEESVALFLEGSVLGAVLHQRGILPFHGSSFIYNGKGIMVSGPSGAGKSSVTAAFYRQGSAFVNDDITPVEVYDSGIMILPVKTRIKLWNDALQKLQIGSEGLKNIRPEMKKFYFPVEKTSYEIHSLEYIFILSSHNKDEYISRELSGIEKYNALRRQIYRKVYLKGMPETEKKYFRELFSLAAGVKVVHIFRPQICDINDTMHFIEKEIMS
ncbi:MAG: hypothetical protein LKI42_03885 [Bacteroidales bacterium]|jgi:hypothetical protein|nr:hypothetical protein [Bacteroidales bacterium]MCI1784904.1 hypothetical protein [Bacteroidales bacterium]